MTAEGRADDNRARDPLEFWASGSDEAQRGVGVGDTLIVTWFALATVGSRSQGTAVDDANVAGQAATGLALGEGDPLEVHRTWSTTFSTVALDDEGGNTSALRVEGTIAVLETERGDQFCEIVVGGQFDRAQVLQVTRWLYFYLDPTKGEAMRDGCIVRLGHNTLPQHLERVGVALPHDAISRQLILTRDDSLVRVDDAIDWPWVQKLLRRSLRAYRPLPAGIGVPEEANLIEGVAVLVRGSISLMLYPPSHYVPKGRKSNLSIVLALSHAREVQNIQRMTDEALAEIGSFGDVTKSQSRLRALERHARSVAGLRLRMSRVDTLLHFTQTNDQPIVAYHRALVAGSGLSLRMEAADSALGRLSDVLAAERLALEAEATREEMRETEATHRVRVVGSIVALVVAVVGLFAALAAIPDGGGSGAPWLTPSWFAASLALGAVYSGIAVGALASYLMKHQSGDDDATRNWTTGVATRISYSWVKFGLIALAVATAIAGVWLGWRGDDRAPHLVLVSGALAVCAALAYVSASDFSGQERDEPRPSRSADM